MGLVKFRFKSVHYLETKIKLNDKKKQKTDNYQYKCFLYFLLKNLEEEPAITYTAIADYASLETSELSFNQGDTLQVLRVGEGGWWFARSQSKAQEGWVPGSYLEQVNEDVNIE